MDAKLEKKLQKLVGKKLHVAENRVKKLGFIPWPLQDGVINPGLIPAGSVVALYYDTNKIVTHYKTYGIQ